MRGLIGCERSGVVREAFRARGHDVWSNDIVPADDDSEFHIIGDVRDVASSASWDFAIFHPPCTHLTSAGARWFKDKIELQAEAIAFVDALWAMPIPKIAIENPIGVLPKRSTLGKATQIIQPWMFGHNESKATCLWLKGLPELKYTKLMTGRFARVHRESPGIVDGKTRQQRRSITYQGIADAMAEQWGKV